MPTGLATSHKTAIPKEKRVAPTHPPLSARREFSSEEKAQMRLRVDQNQAYHFLGNMNKRWLAEKRNSVSDEVAPLTPDDFLSQNARMLAELQIRTGYQVYFDSKAPTPPASFPIELAQSGPFKIRSISQASHKTQNSPVNGK